MMQGLSSADVASLQDLLFPQVAAVYGGDGYTVLVTAALRCRVDVPRSGDTLTPQQRKELLATRQFCWDPAYDLPEDDTVQIAVEGRRWNPEVGTYAEVRGVGAEVLYRRCDLVRVPV